MNLHNLTPKSIVSKLINRARRVVSLQSETPGAPIDTNFKERGLTCYVTSEGKFIVPDYPADDIIAQHIRRNRIFEPLVVEELKRFLDTGGTVIDIGANFGQMAVTLANFLRNNGNVIAIEANPGVYDVLDRNIKLNNLRNVTAIHAAAHERSGVELVFPKPDFIAFKTWGSYGLDPSKRDGDKIRSVAVDDLNITERVTAIKIDVQGCDLFALRGAEETIRKWQMPIIFEYEEQFQKMFGTTFQDYVDFVAKIGYKFERTLMDINYVIVPKNMKSNMKL